MQARDPWVTASMLTALAICYYLALALSHVTLAILTRQPVNPIDRVWDFREIHFRSLAGYRSALTLVLTAALGVPIQVLVVQRAKLILDFAMTMQCLQVLLTSLYSHAFPMTRSWWATWLVSSAIIVFGGEFACMRVELRPITFGNTNNATSSITTPINEPQRSKELLGRKSQDRRSFQIHEDGRLMGDIELQERNRSMEEGRA